MYPPGTNKIGSILVCKITIMTDTIDRTTTGAIGIAADHAGFELKGYIAAQLRQAGYEITDFGNDKLEDGDDFPDYVVPLARAVAAGSVSRGIAICGSGVGACVAANKVKGIRACLITDTFSAHQGVEDDDMNLLCLGGRISGQSLAWELVVAFLKAVYIDAERHDRRLKKIALVESQKAD
jgi:ribose 5-phosphate isomerase B